MSDSNKPQPPRPQSVPPPLPLPPPLPPPRPVSAAPPTTATAPQPVPLPAHFAMPGAPPIPAAIAAPAPSGAPYRVPAPPPPPVVEAPEPELPFTTQRRPRPLLGPALSVFAVMLWAFVVAGQFATSWSFGAPLSQGSALFVMFVTTLTAWIMSIRRSRIAMPPRNNGHLFWRAVGAFVVAFLFFFSTLVAATVVGRSASRDHDFLAAFVLVVISLVAAIAGPKLTSPTAPDRTNGQRFALIVAWIAGTLLTLVAGVDLASNG